MAAMRARRPARGGRSSEGGSGRNSRRTPPPAKPVPRLAAIQLDGIGPEAVGVSRKNVVAVAVSTVMFLGVAVAGATWFGGSLFDAREAFSRSADHMATALGFGVDEIEIAGVSGARADEVRALITPEGRHSLLALDPGDVKTQIESLDWVADARVRRLWPSTLQVQVARRQAFALWQEDGEISVIDYNGERLLAERAADHPNLPLVVGRGAGPAAEPLLIALEELPQVRERVRALVRVADRRWNLDMRSGARIELPEDGAVAALARLEQLQTEHRLLDRPVAEVDLRAPGEVAVRVNPPLSGAPIAASGGA